MQPRRLLACYIKNIRCVSTKVEAVVRVHHGVWRQWLVSGVPVVQF